MRDVVFLAAVVTFFVLSAAFVRACVWIVGSDAAASTATTAGDESSEAAA